MLVIISILIVIAVAGICIKTVIDIDPYEYKLLDSRFEQFSEQEIKSAIIVLITIYIISTAIVCYSALTTVL